MSRNRSEWKALKDKRGEPIVLKYTEVWERHYEDRSIARQFYFRVKGLDLRHLPGTGTGEVFAVGHKPTGTSRELKRMFNPPPQKTPSMKKGKAPLCGEKNWPRGVTSLITALGQWHPRTVRRRSRTK